MYVSHGTLFSQLITRVECSTALESLCTFPRTRHYSDAKRLALK